MENHNQNLLHQIAKIEERKTEIEKAMEDPGVLSSPRKLADLSREHSQHSHFTNKADQYKSTLKKVLEDKSILDDSEDEELKELAEIELEENQRELDVLEQELKMLLIPKDPNDVKNAVMEIRAGTGGDEAALFAGDLFRMYSKYVENNKWSMDILSSSPTELGGFKEVIFSVSGQEVFGKLKYESGVHRVQRVPATETSGRIHTSAASVVVLPEAEEVDVEINLNDLRIDVFRSSGPGGQSVNTTDSAVRITHVPTGIVVTCQDEKSQHKNKAKALKVLRSRLYDIKRKEEEEKQTASRRSMIRSGDRSVKIRTFNYPQGRVTDHRINLTLYRLNEILAGEIDEIINALISADINEKMENAS